MEPFVAYLHYLGAIGIGSVLASELFLFKKDMTYQEARLLQKVDILYLFVALLLLGTGFSRLFWYSKGQDYYFSNLVFSLKMVTFICIGILSIFPTLFYLKWRPLVRDKKPVQVSHSDFRKIRAIILFQFVLLPAIPLFAVLMARGYGASHH
jgi:putative membrane protein